MISKWLGICIVAWPRFLVAPETLGVELVATVLETIPPIRH